MAERDGERVLVGLDFTADRLRALLTDEDGHPVANRDWPLPELDGDEAWAWEVGGRLAELFAVDGQRRSALAIVVAAPGPVEPESGVLLRSDGQEGWDGLGMVEALRRHIGAPIAAESRTQCALLGETWGAAVGDSPAAQAADVLYVTLRGAPAAAMLLGGRVMRGAHFEAGALPAAPRTEDGEPYSDEECEQLAALLADAAALLGPELVLVDGADADLDRVVPLLQRVLDEVAPGPQVLGAALGERAAVIGAVRMATSLAFEGGRRA